MTFQDALARIKTHWETIPKQDHWDRSVNSVTVIEDIEALWLAVTDHSEPYEVDEEWIGITREGEFVWAYASGCSCWDGNYDTKKMDDKEIKAFKFYHDENLNTNWQNKVIEFAKTLV